MRLGRHDYADENVLEGLQVRLVPCAGTLPRQESHVGIVRQGRTHDFRTETVPLDDVLRRVGHGHDNGCVWRIDDILERSTFADRLHASQFIVT